MTYAAHRRIIDCDSHIIELDDFLAAAATAEEAGAIPSMDSQTELPVVHEALDKARAYFEQRQSDPDVMVKFEESLLKVRPNGWSRLGAFDPEERSHALDLFGYEMQWVLPTFAYHQVAHTDDLDLLETGARVLNRAMAAFCAHDERLYAIGFLPLMLGPERALTLMEDGLAAGCHTFMVPTNEPNPDALSFTHPDFDPVWARFVEAAVPFVAHVAVNGEYDAVSPSFRNNGQAPLPVAGDAPASLLGFVAIHNSAQLLLSAMIFDGVFDRHPELRGISMEHGATWLPSWLHSMDFAGTALRKFQKLEHAPSDLVRRHLKFAPFAGEDIGWIIGQVGPELLVYASDFPHPEGTSDPIGKFEKTMSECDEATMQAFYFGNMAEVMGVS